MWDDSRKQKYTTTLWENKWAVFNGYNNELLWCTNDVFGFNPLSHNQLIDRIESSENSYECVLGNQQAVMLENLKENSNGGA